MAVFRIKTSTSENLKQQRPRYERPSKRLATLGWSPKLVDGEVGGCLKQMYAFNKWFASLSTSDGLITAKDTGCVSSVKYMVIDGDWFISGNVLNQKNANSWATIFTDIVSTKMMCELHHVKFQGYVNKPPCVQTEGLQHLPP